MIYIGPLVYSGQEAQTLIVMPASEGGLQAGGKARVLRLGGLQAQGTATVGWTKKYPSSGGVRAGAPSGTIILHTVAARATLATTLPKLVPSISASNDNIAAKLTHLKSSITVWSGIPVRIAAPLTAIRSVMTGGAYQIAGNLPMLSASITAYAGVKGTIDTTLPVPAASIIGLPGNVGVISASVPNLVSSVDATAGYIASIGAAIPSVASKLSGNTGSVGTVATTLPAVHAKLLAGLGAVGTISAAVPKVIAAISVLAQATTQQLVMVVGTHTNMVSTYENYSFNSFCEIDGVYYAVGEAGLCVIDSGDLDYSALPISAGLSTGLMQLGEPHLKRIYDAYMTLRTAGDLTFTISVDEGVPVILTMNAHQFATFIQRRVVIPKGLVGKSWKFEINNVDGTDFDFGHLGLNVEVSARRIRG